MIGTPPSYGRLGAMEIRTEVEIAAPPARVWAVLENFDGYAEWNPFMVKVAGKPEVGARIDITIEAPGLKRRTIREKVRVVTRDQELVWGGGPPIPYLADGVHFFRLVDLGDGRTRVLHGEDFTGLLVPLLKGMIAKVAKGFEATNEALKRRVEASG
jgi:hypothetical protein